MKMKCKFNVLFSILMLSLCNIVIADETGNVEQSNIGNKTPSSTVIGQNVITKNAVVGANVGKQMNVVNSKIIKFQLNEALNSDFHDIRIDDGIEFLHSDNEYQTLYDKFVKQNVKIDNTKKTRNMQDDEDDEDMIKETKLKLSSLYYYNDDNWGCKINNRFIKKSNQNEAHSGVSIVKVNKDSILFVLNKTKEKDIENVRKLKKAKYRYNNDYYIVKNGNVQYIMFRLHIGQSINLKNFHIK